MKVGFIDYYLDEPHAREYFEGLPKFTEGKVEVAYAYGEIPAPSTGKTGEQFCEERGIEFCATPEEVVEKSEGIIVLAPDHCNKHEELAQAALRSGKPVFIDKTFAPDLEAAKRIFALADEHGTPVCTFSALRYAVEYEDFDKDEIKALSFWGGGALDTYSIHQLEPLVMLMGVKATKLLLTKGDNWYTALVRFEDGRTGTITGGYGYPGFSAMVQLEPKARKIEIQCKFFNRSIRAIGNFMLTGKPDFHREETLQIMSLRTALLKAEQQLDTWITVE